MISFDASYLKPVLSSLCLSFILVVLSSFREWEEGNQARHLFPGLEESMDAYMNDSTSSTVIPKGTAVPDA